MISLKKEDCCGCGSCEQSCPRGCIEMRVDGEGFLYPYVDAKKCVECHLCEKNCPSLNKPAEKESAKICRVAVNGSEERIESSSGGIFVLLAKKFLKEGGVVAGAAFDDKWLVHHVICESEESLQKLMRSKYLQSRTENCFKDTKRLLEAGKKVLYTGTACQIAGLRAFLNKDYENLYTVDVLCHGVPSPGVWSRYVAEMKKTFGSEITDASFRDKSTGWRSFSMAFRFENGQSYIKKHEEDPFMRLFLKNAILRPSCHSCKFKSINRPSDMTIGDAWGIEKVQPEIDDNKGVSVVIAHNAKGKEMLEGISAEITEKEVGLDAILPASADSRKSVSKAQGRALVFLYYKWGKSIGKMCVGINHGIKSKILRKIVRNR